MSNIFQALKFAPIAVVAVFLLILILSGYVKAPPDVAYIISGFRKTRVLVGRAGIKIPFLERLDKLSLRMISVDVKTTDFVPNSEYINVKVDATVKIRVGRDDELMQLAMANFLNAKEEQIVGKVQDTLEGNMREIIGQMKLSEMVTDRKAFGERVQENALPDLRKMGLELISFNVQSFSDQNGVIDDLGIDNVSRIKKDAAIAKAEADRDVAVKQAEADQAANEARVNAEKQIAEKQNELAIRQAELKKDADVKKAEADAAYEIQAKEQSKALETADVNAQIARAEREAELKEKQVLIAKQALDAEVRAQADAERYRQEQEAQAELFRRQKEAEARRYEQEQDAEAVKKAAEAAKFAKEQEAAGIAAVGKAEAEAIQARALAEAEGIDKKAVAMQKYGEAAVVEMVMKSKLIRILGVYSATTTNESFRHLPGVLIVLGPHPPGGAYLILRTWICTAAESDYADSHKHTPRHPSLGRSSNCNSFFCIGLSRLHKKKEVIFSRTKTAYILRNGIYNAEDELIKRPSILVDGECEILIDWEEEPNMQLKLTATRSLYCICDTLETFCI